MPNKKQPHLIHLEYRADIDGLRALAILLVLAFHASQGKISGAFIGVDIFFVISGYLISKIIFSSLEKNRFSYLEFYVRRIRRIFPALTLVLLTCILFGYFFLLQEEYQNLAKHMVGSAYFVENFLLLSETGYFDKDAATKPFLHLWSLAIEEQFYLLWPLLVAFIWKRGWSFIALTSAIFSLSFITNLFLVEQEKAAAFYLPQARFWELMIGGILAHLSLHNKQLAMNRNFPPAAGVFLICVGLVFLDSNQSFPGYWALLPAIGAALIISADPKSWINRQLSNNTLVFIGKISYPLYLWHWPLISFLHIYKGSELGDPDIAIAVFLAFILAWATNHFVENPLRHGKHGHFKAGALLFALVSSSSLGMFVYVSAGLPDRKAASNEIIYAGDVGHDVYHKYAADNYHLCTPPDIAALSLKWGEYIRCQQSHSHNTPDLAIIGDSHAEHLLLGLAGAMPEKNIVFYIQNSTPFIDNKEFTRIFEHTLENRSIKVVVLTAYWHKRIHSTKSPDEFKRRLLNTVDRLIAAGKEVYLTDDIPHFPFEPNRCRLKGSQSTFPEGCSTQGETLMNEHNEVLEILNTVISHSHGAKLIGTYQYFCTTERCSMTHDNQLLYRDPHHLNINGSIYLGGILASQMKTIN